MAQPAPPGRGRGRASADGGRGAAARTWRRCGRRRGGRWTAASHERRPSLSDAGQATSSRSSAARDLRVATPCLRSFRPRNIYRARVRTPLDTMKAPLARAAGPHLLGHPLRRGAPARAGQIDGLNVEKISQSNPPSPLLKAGYGVSDAASRYFFEVDKSTTTKKKQRRSSANFVSKFGLSEDTTYKPSCSRGAAAHVAEIHRRAHLADARLVGVGEPAGRAARAAAGRACSRSAPPSASRSRSSTACGRATARCRRSPCCARRASLPPSTPPRRASTTSPTRRAGAHRLDDATRHRVGLRAPSVNGCAEGTALSDGLAGCARAPPPPLRR